MYTKHEIIITIIITAHHHPQTCHYSSSSLQVARCVCDKVFCENQTRKMQLRVFDFVVCFGHLFYFKPYNVHKILKGKTKMAIIFDTIKNTCLISYYHVS